MSNLIIDSAAARTRALVGDVWLQEPTIPSHTTRVRTDATPATAAFMAVHACTDAKQGSPPRGTPR